MEPTGSLRRLSAILMADVVGYSRLMQQDEEGTVAALEACRAIFSEQIAAHRGHLVNAPGDSILAEFQSVVDAVKAAVKIQQRIGERNEGEPDNRRMAFRIGVNLGDVIAKDGVIYGDGVNVAARLESLADPGGITLSGAAYEQVEGKVDLGFEFIGRKEVKNIAKPVPAFRVVSKGVAAAPSTAKANRGALRSWKMGLAAAAVVLLVAAGLIAWYLLSGQPSTKIAQDGDLPLPDKPSIAVLPFTNMSGDPEQEYFSDGITDDIITDLSKLRGLMVIARNSTFTYKGKAVDVRQVGRELGVRHVLEGSVRKAGGRVRITAQLVDATTGDHVWSERYDRPLQDIFALQDEIARKIVLALDVHLVEGDDARIWRESTDNPEAYDYFLRGIKAYWHFTREDFLYARQMFEKALELDAEYALAMTQLGWLDYDAAGIGWSDSPEDSFDKAREWANRSLALDDSVGTAYSLLSLLELRNENHEQAIVLGRRAVAFNPNSPETLALLSFALTYSGKAEEGLKTMKKAMRLNPFPPGWYYHALGAAYLLMEKFDQSIEAYQECLFRTSEFGWCHINLTIAYMGAGKEEQGRAQAKELLLINPRFTTDHVAIRRIKDPTVRERFKSYLRQAGLK